MNTQTTQTLRFSHLLKSKINDYKLLSKFGLTTSVVMSSVFGFLMAKNPDFSIPILLLFVVSGYLITSSSNALNELIEKDTDKLMKRTANRPLPTGRMSATEALLFAGITGILGIIILWYFFNIQSALVGALSLLSYSFIYTPLKKVSPISVFVGAIPGALPITIGYLAANGGIINAEAMLLFSIQFIWQFPHFWSIAWLGNDDYENAGFKLMPTKEGKGKSVVMLCLTYTFVLGLLSFYYLHTFDIGIFSMAVAIALWLYFLYCGLHLLKKQNNESARKLMFASLIYLTITQIVWTIDKWV